ncbi:MAG: hypothetical protein ACXADY_24065 [Candidatus Hodarchaeales archaeon]|jgi:hypothetical protein
MNFDRIFTLLFLFMIVGIGSSQFFFPLSFNNDQFLTNKLSIVPPLRERAPIQELSIESNFSVKSQISQDEPLVRPLIQQDQGTSRFFNVTNLETTDHYQINATLLLNSTTCLIYSNLTSIATTTLEEMNHTFEAIIYPKLTNYFGSPPDIDNNSKIIILIFDILDGLSGGQYIAGFFDSLNQHLNKDLHPSQRYSNEAEILHIDKLALEDFDTLAHEFQHLIHYDLDEDEDTWLDEGASMFSEYLVGYDIGTHQTSFESNPDVSLTFWDYYNTQDLLLANYGSSYFFYRFLAEKYGGVTTIQNLVLNPNNGTSSVEQVLANAGYDVDFNELFRNWTIANVLIENSSQYSYENITLTMRTEEFDLSSISRTGDVPFWGTDYLVFNCSNQLPFSFEFQGSESSEFLVTAILTNTSITPFSIKIVPLSLSAEGLGNFSTDDLGISAEKIILVISAYTKSGTPDHDNLNPSPNQTYWFTVNPHAIPHININSPVNASYANQEIWLNFTVDEVPSWIGYSIDGNPNITITGNTLLTSLSEGSHSVIIFANHSTGNMGISEVVWFTIDVTSPIVNISTPSQVYYLDLYILVQYSFSEAGIIQFYLNDVIIPFITNESTIALPDGQYNLTLTVTDPAGHVGTATAIFTIDTLPPNAIIISPGDQYYNHEDINVSWWQEPGSTLLGSYVDKTNTSLVNNSVKYFAEGVHNITLVIQDQAGNNRILTTIFGVDLTAPEITILSPDQTIHQTKDIMLSFAVDDEKEIPVAILIYLDGKFAALSNNSIIPGLTEGQHNLTIEVTDAAGNRVVKTVIFTVELPITTITTTITTTVTTSTATITSSIPITTTTKKSTTGVSKGFEFAIPMTLLFIMFYVKRKGKY